VLTHCLGTNSTLQVLGAVDKSAFTLTMSAEDGHRVLRVAGDLDLAVRNQFFKVCIEGDWADVVVDLADVTFMDCAGYGGLVAARLVLQARGGSLTLRNYTVPLMSLLSLVEFTGARTKTTSPLGVEMRELRWDVVDQP